MKKSKPVAWTLVIVGCCFVLSWLLGFTGTIGLVETAFYQQLIELAPVLTISPEDGITSLPYGLENLLMLSVFSMMAGYLLWSKSTWLPLVFVVLLIFLLFMLQILLAIMAHFWLPTIWTIVSFSSTALLLFLRSKYISFNSIKPFSREQKLQAIDQKITEKNYEAAVVMLKNCEFSDEMFDIAYDLGVKLEQQENWILARYLYTWLVQFDPGIEDFVTRMDYRINPDMDEDLSTREITQNKDQFGHYQLAGKKALGATATVYEAFDLLTHKRIALKILNQKIDNKTGDSDVLTFLHEAMTVSKLDHPNIVKIHDADIINEKAYIAMDYIAGYPMSERLRRKKLLTVAESLRIMQSVLNALILAHQKDIVHGDIKPANIMFDQKRKLYILTDFGAANNGSQLLGNEKRIIGTPAYMSPEQLSGAKIDGRSDLFSLAVTIYHLLTGVQPFAGQSLAELKKNVLSQEVNISLLSVPEMIRQVLDKALQKKTYQRFTDASQMLQAVIYCDKKLKELVVDNRKS